MPERKSETSLNEAQHDDQQDCSIPRDVSWLVSRLPGCRIANLRVDRLALFVSAADSARRAVSLAAVLAVAALVGITWYLSRVRAERRWRAALDAYAEKEQRRRLAQLTASRGASEHSSQDHGVFPLIVGCATSASIAHGEMKMLVLSRRIGEQIVIDGNIRVHGHRDQRRQGPAGHQRPAVGHVDRSEVHERRGEFAYQCDWSQPAPAAPVTRSWRTLPRTSPMPPTEWRFGTGMGDQWLELKLDLWGALTEALEKRSCLDLEIQLPYDPGSDVD